jgi:hypothetical protein
MLDKVAVAGDITQALDRRGVWTCAITVIGGTESTAVKLQSCETASGSFTDFLTLIPASEASATQYKGFVVDLHGAGKFIKVTGATIATAVFGDCDYDVKKVAIKAGEVPSGADLEDNKTATINVSEYTEPVEITPSEGKDGMKKATITLSNIPSGEAGNVYCAYDAPMSDSDIVPDGEYVGTTIFDPDLGNRLFTIIGDGVKTVKELITEMGGSSDYSWVYFVTCTNVTVNEQEYAYEKLHLYYGYAG